MYGWRRFLLRSFGASIGSRVLIRPSVRVTYPWKLKIGDYSWIGDHVELYSLDEITIGSNAVVSQGCYLCTGTHDHRDIEFSIRKAPITVGDESWLAAQVFVGPGVSIGRGTVVGVRSLVLGDLPELVVALGQPAKVVRQREVR
jgi:putative colanic acid biosynthesis acetyltransferase WcaF